MSNSVTKETMMANNSGVSNSMSGHKWGVVGDDRGVVGDDRGVVGQGVGNDRSVNSVSDSRGMVARGSGMILRVLGLAVVGDISNISVITIDVVVDVLDSAIRKSHGVRSLGVTSTIRRLGSIEVSLGVVITHGVCVAVGCGGVIAGGGVVTTMHRGVDSVGHDRGVDTMSQDGGVDQTMTVERGAVSGGEESRDTSEGLEEKMMT